MSTYAVFFDKDNTTYRLPVNPEIIETGSQLAIEKYEVLKLGQISIPTHMELSEYSFEFELPKGPTHYTETAGDFRDADFYLALFKSWRESSEPVRFIASNGIGEDINSLVLIESLSVVERSGEEGDKYVSMQLLEYQEFEKKLAKPVVPVPGTENTVAAVKTLSAESTNPKSTGEYVVQSGDTLWGIAKKYYGDGSKYTKIADANKSIVKNPSLIYPGQRLVIPV